MKKLWTVLVVVVLGLSGCSQNSVVEDTNEFVNSSFVSSKIKAKLVAEVGLKGFNIGVSTSNDEIILTGIVDKPQQVQLAGSVARSVKGARRVRNHIVVR
jgi:osmotically-inducible protein OsmY